MKRSLSLSAGLRPRTTTLWRSTSSVLITSRRLRSSVTNLLVSNQDKKSLSGKNTPARGCFCLEDWFTLGSMSMFMKGVTLPGAIVAVTIFILPFVTTTHLFNGATNAKFFFMSGSIALLALYFCYLLATNTHVLALRGRWLLLFRSEEHTSELQSQFHLLLPPLFFKIITH